MIVEGNETFDFTPSAANERDMFDDSYTFSLVIFDNDGKIQLCTHDDPGGSGIPTRVPTFLIALPTYLFKPLHAI